MPHPTAKILTSIHGNRRIGLGAQNELIINREPFDGNETAQALVLNIARKQLTTAQVLALFATPIEVIAAPGAGKAILVHHAIFAMDYAGTAYAADAGEDLVLAYTDASGLIVTDPLDGEAFIQAAADAIAYAPGVGASNQGIEMTQNAAIVAKMQVAEVVTGNSAVDITVFYEVLTIGDYFI